MSKKRLMRSAKRSKDHGSGENRHVPDFFLLPDCHVTQTPLRIRSFLTIVVPLFPLGLAVLDADCVA
ncbi:hypothetical protein GGQ85_002706 [Nitrobacter vulgaris]|jgi:hypothetical protein|nr:hypothetical protein [Nitrobacter vulgaris]